MASDLTEWFNIARHVAKIENTILLGQQQEDGSISGVQERSGAASKSNSSENQTQETKDKKLSKLLHTLQVMQDYIERLAKEIEKMEDIFRQRDGDEWREKLALKILGEDDIPQRRSDENIEAYRERLEIFLIDELLNDDGSIKGEYKNHPELSDYAQWAQKQYHSNSARVAVNELENKNTSHKRQEEILDGLEQRGNIEELTFAGREATAQNEIQSQIKDITDNARDSATQIERSASAGINFNS